MNLNKVFLIGRLTADPQLRTTPAGQSVATFGVATNRNWVSKTGERKEEAQFHNVVVWGKQAEIANQFLRKGAMVFVEGRLQTRGWQGNDGQQKKTTEIICERFQMGPRAMGHGAGVPKDASVNQEPPKEELPEINIEEGEIKPEDVPF